VSAHFSENCMLIELENTSIIDFFNNLNLHIYENVPKCKRSGMVTVML